MDERLKTNLALWNDMVSVHVNSSGYGVNEFRNGEVHLYPIEIEEVGTCEVSRSSICNATSAWTRCRGLGLERTSPVSISPTTRSRPHARSAPSFKSRHGSCARTSTTPQMC